MKTTVAAIAGGILLLASSGTVSGQDPVDLPLVVHSGDRLLIEYSHERNDNGQAKTGHIVAEIAIRDVGDDGFRATWTTSSVDVGGARIDTSSPQAGAFLLGVPIEYMADSDGSPVRIEDKNQLLDSLLEMPLISSGNSETVASMRSLFESMSEEALAQLFLKVPSHMALCQGTSLSPGELNEGVAQVPSPFGSAPVDAVVSYSLRAFDAQRAKAQIEYRLSLDPAGAKKLAIELLDQIDSPNKPSQSEIEGLSIERNDSASCEVNAESGWVESVRFVTEHKVLDQFKSETFLVSVTHSPVRVD